MDSVAFLHNAIAYEDPNSELELRSLDELNLKMPTSVALGLLSAGVIGVSLNQADQAQALMYPGDSGPGVSQLQEQLGIRADGVYGPQTEAAVYNFQVRFGLMRDGIAGPETLSRLGLPSNLGPGGGSGGGEQPVGGSATVTASSGLLIRSYPGGPVIGGLSYGQSVSLSGAVENGWYQLASGGWVSGAFLDFGGGGSGEVPISGDAVVIASSGVNVRSSPWGSVWYGLPYGASVSLTGNRSYLDGYTWVELADGGWVAEAYLSYR